MSADTTPISPSRFAAALKDLSIGMLHLKVLEIRNSVAHLQYSNDQLRPYADGTADALSSSSTPGEPDQDCVDAIRENEQVIDRMAERIALVRAEVEERGVSWTEFQSKDEVDGAGSEDKDENEEAAAAAAAVVNGHHLGEEEAQARNEDANRMRHSAWEDGTFQTGTIRNGEVNLDDRAGRPNGTINGPAGGSLSDEQLRAALEERMRNLGTENDDDDGAEGGLHL